jgi:hypothetical protein
VATAMEVDLAVEKCFFAVAIYAEEQLISNIVLFLWEEPLS